MAVKTEKELSEDQRAHWLKAVAAIELRNFGYAISLLQGILKQEPQFLTGRQLLRRTEVTRLKAAKKKFFNVSTASVAVMKAQREMKKDAKRAVELIEKILEDEPYNKQANLALKDAAVAAGWLETGVFALQTLLEENARDTKLLHELARLYHELGESEREVEIYNRISAINPADAAAMRLGKDASARDSMKSGGWGAAASYRDLIKDKEAAVSLEQQSRMVLGDESLDQQIEETYQRHQAEPQSVDLARGFFQLPGCQIKHSQLAITSPERIHRLQACIRILSGALQLRQALTKMPRIHQMFTQFKTKLQIGRIALDPFPRFLNQHLRPPLFRCRQCGILFREYHGIAGVVRD